MFSAFSSLVRSASFTSTSQGLSRSASRLSRTAAVFAVSSGFVAAGFAGAGVANAAPVTCVSPPSANQILVDGTASCGATSAEGSRATATAADSGTAVSVAETGGTSTTYATGFGTALGASRAGGTSYAGAIGGGIAHSWADAGSTTIAIAGWGSGATAEAAGVDCVGPLSLALNLASGQFCILGS
ncbi:hypothetical protein ABIB34_001010 [Rhodococcus sp. UYP5]